MKLYAIYEYLIYKIYLRRYFLVIYIIIKCQYFILKQKNILLIAQIILLQIWWHRLTPIFRKFHLASYKKNQNQNYHQYHIVIPSLKF